MILTVLSDHAHAARIKDIANIEGVRKNQLIGYGLVVGLDGTGDGNKTELVMAISRNLPLNPCQACLKKWELVLMRMI